ncbi:MAG: peptidoglycan bridge formation glycyltransferase FemA/FemB family protein [candidate division WOR-3 bacterium]|nr:MAG: peptidoglycan bridge formation glycyltransferase FemA/FemB family protein [candidate division WOR-3 bacterium]
MNIVNKLDRQIWSDFVRDHPKGNIFQTPEMYDVYSNTKHNEPLLFAVVSDNGAVQGLLVAVLLREFDGPLGGLTTRSVVWGGPLVAHDDLNILALLLRAYEKEIRARALYTQFRNLWDIDKLQPNFLELKYSYKDHLNIIIDLTKSEQSLWDEMHSKRRNEIRKAYKEGVKVRELDGKDDIDTSYEILKGVYAQAGLPLADKTMFQGAFRVLGPHQMIRYFGAFIDDKLIGVICILAYKDLLYDWYAGSRFEFLRKYPNDILPWEVFKWGKANGYSTFDFGGAGSPDKDYGVRRFKQKFGGAILNFGRFEKIHQPGKYKTAITMFYLWRKCRWKR